MIGKVDSRYMIAFGFLVVSASMFFMTTHLYQGMDFKTAVELRCFQSVGLAFLFVPINTLVYADIPPEKNNAVSGIVNLSRNMGGDIGIAMVTTLIARRSQLHQSTLSSHTTGYDQAFTARLRAIAAGLEHSGASSWSTPPSGRRRSCTVSSSLRRRRSRVPRCPQDPRIHGGADDSAPVPDPQSKGPAGAQAAH